MIMTAPKTEGGSREGGAVLLVAIVVTFIVVLFIGQATTTALSESRLSRYEVDYTRALALAEGVTEAAQKEILDTVANFGPPPAGGTVNIAGTDYSFTATPIGPQINRPDTDGVTLMIQPYLLTATVESGAALATVDRIVDLTLTPIFQFMIFFDDDLELLPGPSMTLEGRVHSNGSMYLGCGSTITVDTEYLRCTGDILRERKSNGAQTGGNIDIKVTGQSTFVNMDPTMDSDNANWVNLALNTWEGTVQSGAHGVTEVSIPEIGSIKAIDPVTGNKGYYHENAGLVIRDGQAFDGNDNPVALPPGTITEKTMYDAREGKTITVTELDLELLNTSGSFPANGLVYAYRTDASPAQPNGVRLANGEELAGPLTVVTEDPLYVLGDFNTMDKKPAAVMCDALNLLSNAWDDTKTANSLPTAEDTQYNLAAVTGNVPTPDGGGAYSGGFENLPRFHERWSWRSATIRGSFIKIFESEIAVSPWKIGGDVYTPPIRDWRYDADLENTASLPPFSPNAVYVRRVAWSDHVGLPFGGSPSN